MITIKNKYAIEKMTIAGQLLANMFNLLPDIIKPEITTLQINNWIDDYLKKNNLVSSMRGFMGYKHVSCISLNDEVVHGVPNNNIKLKMDDLVKIDVCASFKGYCADMARSYFLGDAPPHIQKFMKVGQASLDKGIEKIKIGNYLGDVSFAIQQEIDSNGYGIVREFAGHGIGKDMHEEPEILNYGKPGNGPIMREGMAFAIEPMLTMGSHKIYIATDKWTVKTVDKSLAIHVEDTVIVDQQGPKIITRII